MAAARIKRLFGTQNHAADLRRRPAGRRGLLEHDH